MKKMFCIAAVWVALMATTLEVCAQARGGAMPDRTPPPRPERPVRAMQQHPLDRWLAMPPAQRERALSKKTPEERANIEARINKWQQMTPEQRDRARKFAALSPDKKKVYQEHAQWMQTLPPDRQQIVRREVNSLQQLSPEARFAEIESPSFQKRFDETERERIGKLVSVMPE